MVVGKGEVSDILKEGGGGLTIYETLRHETAVLFSCEQIFLFIRDRDTCHWHMATGHFVVTMMTDVRCTCCWNTFMGRIRCEGTMDLWLFPSDDLL